MTATVETVSEQLDLAAIMPSEKVMTAVARSVTVQDEANATVQVAKPQIVGEGDKGDSQDADASGDEDGDDFWHTSVGKFKFSIDALPQPLQYIHQLLIELPNIDKPDILYFMLQCLHTMVLHGDAFTKAARDHRGFFIWCQENLLIKNLWNLLTAEYSHICEVCVPLLLHCITLPCGSDSFWKILQDNFHHSDWRVRFQSVERVTLLARFMDSTPLRSEVSLQAALATAFCFLIASMDDINVYVAQRSTLYLGTIHDAAVKSLLYCLESQFDMFIVDRPVVLQSVYQLHNSLSDRKILSWEFFLNRFDTLFVEAQVNLEKTGDILYLRDLRNSENGSEILSNKISKAREALSQSDTSGSMTKTLSASFGTKWPYKRTMSAPANIIPRQESKIEKEKVYNRQVSAPLLKRKTSRFGLGQFLTGNTNTNPSNVASTHTAHTHLHQSQSHQFLQVNNVPKQSHHHLHRSLHSPVPSSGPPRSPVSPSTHNHHHHGHFHFHSHHQTSSAQSQLQAPTHPSHQDQQKQQNLLPQQQNQTTAGTTAGVPTDGHVHSMGAGVDDLNFSGNLFRVIDLEETDKETIHLLVFLLMQFMSRTDLAFPTDEKPMCKVQAIVLRHLYMLMGFNQNDKLFQFTSQRMRESATFNVFLANLPQVLDQNNLIGTAILHFSIQVLLYAPYPSFNIPTAEAMQNMVYSYSLWYLEQHVRRNWLMALLTILYKYQYTMPPFPDLVQNLIRIVMNSLESQFHVCRRIPTTVVLDVPPRRDLSQPSLGTDPDERDLTPPPSPMFPAETASSSKKLVPDQLAKPCFRKYQDSSIECDETESELVAIPESDFSDSTLHGSSAPGSFDDAIHFDDIVTPMKPEYVKPKAIAQVKTNYLASAQIKTANVAMSPLAIAEKNDETTEIIKKIHKISVTASGPDKSNNNTIHSTSTTVIETVNTTSIQTKCSLSEGVRMMVTSSMLGTEQPKAQAILNPPVNVQKAIVITQSNNNSKPSSSKDAPFASMMMANIASNQFKTISAVAGADNVAEESKNNGNKVNSKSQKSRFQDKPKALVSPNGVSTTWLERSPSSPTTCRTLGRQQKIIETSITPASTPVQLLSAEEKRAPYKKGNMRSIEKQQINYGSPESPLSKMDLMSPPADATDTALLSPSSIGHLEIPTPERLLPIGQNEGSLSTLVDRVREALQIPDISHLKQDSTESCKDECNSTSRDSRVNSPRKLIKQVALIESPPNILTEEVTPLTRKAVQSIKIDKMSNAREETVRTQRQRFRKVGPFAIGSQSISDTKSKYAGAWPPNQSHFPDDSDDDEDDTQRASFASSDYKSSSYRIGDECICNRCSECGALKEEYTDEELGLFIVILGTFVHREPALAAPFLPDILVIVSRVALHHSFSWQCESSTQLPGGSQSVAHQFIRCVLHQLAPSGVFYQIFLTQNNENVRKKFFRSVASALLDFTELNPASPVQMLVESLNSKKTLPPELPIILRNLSEYLMCIPIDVLNPAIWTTAVQGIESLFRRLIFILPTLEDSENLLDIMVSVLRIPGLYKSILDPFSKVLSFAIQNLSLKHKVLHDLCILNSRAFNKDRDKYYLCRQIIFELVQALKFKTNIPDKNLLLLVGMVLQDAGGCLPQGLVAELPEQPPIFTNNAAECMRQYLNDILEFLNDFHTLSKIKNFKNGHFTSGLSEDTLGGILKGAISQYLALEMSRGNSKENRAVARYLPWLYNAPTSLQQGPKEFTECVGHMRLLSWLLMGSLTHTALVSYRRDQFGQHGASVHYQMQSTHTIVQPVPQDASCHIADHIQVIFAGFAEQSKTSVLHMTAFQTAFTLCQLWTVYLEQISQYTSPGNPETHNVSLGILFEFWAKVTPCILQIQNNPKISEMINVHFLSLLEALKETRSTVLPRLLPLWSPVLSSNSQTSGTLNVRLQNCRDNFVNPDEIDLHPTDALLKWLQRLQFKMGQIELQSSTATQCFNHQQLHTFTQFKC